MTIGPAPMIRIEAMSVRLGIEAREGAQKKGALLRVLRSRADRGKSGARALFRPESPGREGALSPMWAAPAGHASFVTPAWRERSCGPDCVPCCGAGVRRRI